MLKMASRSGQLRSMVSNMCCYTFVGLVGTLLSCHSSLRGSGCRNLGLCSLRSWMIHRQLASDWGRESVFRTYR